ncbi:MAG: hypothetical protein WBW94_15390 [Anaerolineales bacterium]
MKNKKAIGILCFVVAVILLVVGIVHLSGKDILWGGADLSAAIVLVILGITNMGVKVQ